MKFTQPSLLTAGLVGALFTTTGCIQEIGFFCERGEGPVVTQQVDIDDITGFSLATVADVFLTQGETQSIEIEGQQNIIDLILNNSEVRNGIWDIDPDRCIRLGDEQLSIRITIPTLTQAHISGAGCVEGVTPFVDLDDVDLSISGAGSMTMDLTGNTISSDISGAGDISGCYTANSVILTTSGAGDYSLCMDTDNLQSRVSGAGNVELTGTATALEFRSSGVGQLDAFEFEVAEARVSLSGAGDAEVWVTDRLDVTISGTGDVDYIGSPELSVNISGTGNVRDRN
ncbi:MAG: head GIN domain-containing protein [Bacteroidota bacterium]